VGKHGIDAQLFRLIFFQCTLFLEGMLLLQSQLEMDVYGGLSVNEI
jgi:hypothetical protein